MNRADAEEYTGALGQIVAGSWRQIALGVRLGVPYALGVTTREWVEKWLGGYVRLSIGERRDAVLELNGQGMTQREIGDVLGVAQKTVDRDLESYDSDESPDMAPLLRDDDEPESSDSVEDYAASIAREREERLTAWADNLREAMRRLGRMVGFPIPPDLAARFTVEENALLVRILTTLEGGDYGFLN
jgi:hypothetical protein